MDSMNLQAVLERVRSFFTSAIMQDANAWLPSHLGPYSCNGPYGGNVQMRSVQDQHLTCSILRVAMPDLLNVVVIKDGVTRLKLRFLTWTGIS